MSGPDLDERRRIRRGRRLFLLLVMGTAVVLAVVAGAVFAWLGGYDSAAWKGEPPRWAQNLGLVLIIAGLVIEVGVIVYVVRSGRHWANRDSRLWGISWSRRRQVIKQVRRGGEIAEEELPLLRHAAEQRASQRWHVGLLAGLLIVQAGQALMQFSAVMWAFLAVLVGLFPVVVAQMLRDIRRAEAFLRAHPTPGEDAQDRTVSGM